MTRRQQLQQLLTSPVGSSVTITFSTTQIDTSNLYTLARELAGLGWLSTELRGHDVLCTKKAEPHAHTRASNTN